MPEQRTMRAYAPDSPNWECWFALEHKEERRRGVHIAHAVPPPSHAAWSYLCSITMSLHHRPTSPSLCGAAPPPPSLYSAAPRRPAPSTSPNVVMSLYRRPHALVLSLSGRLSSTSSRRVSILGSGKPPSLD